MKSKISVFYWIGFLVLLFFSVEGGVLLRALVVSGEMKLAGDKKLNQIEPQLTYSASIPLKANSAFLDSSALTADPDRATFLSFKDDFIRDKKDFIEIDLREMRLRLYGEGLPIKEIAVLSKGRDGSWWETPTGKYEALDREANHFSSIGKVWMPWSVRFYGNFYIHGWPYYPDGTPVARNFSGGCVRLSSEDAKAVFEYARSGMPILVLDEPDVAIAPPRYILEKSEADIAIPELSAKAAFVADMDSGLTLLNKNADEPLPVASLTKLMSGVVASELIYLERSATVIPAMLGANIFDVLLGVRLSSPFVAGISLVAGEQYTAFDLLYPMLMQSSNQAASAIASFLGEDRFVEQMNSKARSLGMEASAFVDPSGKGNGNVSNGRDLLKLAKYILEKRRFLFDISKGKDYLVFGESDFSELANYNEFAERPALIGVKNGETKAAGQTYLAVWEFASGEEGRSVRVGMVLLGSTDRKRDAEIILDWLKNNFSLEEEI